MRPRPSLNKKVLVSVIVGILVVIAIIVAMVSAFGGQQPAPPEQTPPPAASSQEPPQEEDIQKPPQTFVEDDPPEESEVPEETPEQPQDEQQPAKDPAEEEPAPEQPPETPPKTELTVQKIWDGMRASMGEAPTANMTLSGTNLQELYGVDPAICTEFVLKKAGTAVTPEEYLIVRGSESNLTIVEQACQKRQITLSEQWGNTKDFSEMIANYQVVRHGEYLFFGISPNISQLVGIFQGIMLAS